MQFASIVVAAGIGLGCCGSVEAIDAKVDGAWTEAKSLRELPVGIQVLLGVGLGPESGGIADRDASFNQTDIVIDNLPRLRFAVGTIGDGKAVVAVEQGGIGYAVRAVEFRLVGDTWAVTRCGWLRGLPHRGKELLAAFDGRQPAGGWICPGSDGLKRLRPPPGA